MTKSRLPPSLLIAPVALVLFALAACGEKSPRSSEDPAVQATIDRDVELKAKEEQLARREAELALKERELNLARREAELARRAAFRSKPEATPTPPPQPVAQGPKWYTIPEGTTLPVELPAAISTKTARVGDRVAANLTSDVVVDGKVIVAAGGLLQGSITEVISGGKTIGGTPTLGLTFDNLTLADGRDTRVIGQVAQASGKSATVREAPKVTGNTAPGAGIDEQVDGDERRVIGDMPGAAAGIFAAYRAGTEVELPAGTVLGFVLDAPVLVEFF